MKWKNIPDGTSTFFITATINRWKPLLMHPEPRGILLQDLSFYRKKYSASISAYVIMPEHYHYIVTLPPEQHIAWNQNTGGPGKFGREVAPIHNWLRDTQSHSSQEISKWLKRMSGRSDERLQNCIDCLAKGGKEGSGFTIWKEQARAEGIFSGRILEQKIEYIHENPVRRGLVQHPREWKWSSWTEYFTDDKGLATIHGTAIQE